MSDFFKLLPRAQGASSESFDVISDDRNDHTLIGWLTLQFAKAVYIADQSPRLDPRASDMPQGFRLDRNFARGNGYIAPGIPASVASLDDWATVQLSRAGFAATRRLPSGIESDLPSILSDVEFQDSIAAFKSERVPRGSIRNASPAGGFIDNPESGEQAAAFINGSNGDRLFVATGTNETWTDISNYPEIGYSQYLAVKPAIFSMAEEMRQGSRGGTLYLSGHSLGGMIAQLAAYDLKKAGYADVPVKVITFDAPPSSYLIKDYEQSVANSIQAVHYAPEKSWVNNLTNLRAKFDWSNLGQMFTPEPRSHYVGGEVVTLKAGHRISEIGPAAVAFENSIS